MAITAPQRRGTDGDVGRIRVLIAEDEASVREALAELVCSEQRLELVGAAADTDEAIALANDTQPDVVLLDVRMPGGGGPRAAREILATLPRTKVIALSAFDDRATVIDMLRAGAAGYLVKGTDPEEIVTTLIRAAAGASALSTQVAAGVIAELVSLLDSSERLARDLHDFRQQRAELVQNLSHELFTPTAVIQGSAKLLAKHGQDLSTDDLEMLTSGVAKATQRLRRLVDNVAIASDLDEIHPDPAEPTAIGSLIETAVAACGTDGGRVRVGLVSREATAWSSPELGPRALGVLLENALALAPGQPVEVEVRQDRDEVRIDVLDRGPGVSPEMADRIFEPFVQADGGTTRSHEGLGMGLYMARRIMAAAGGRVEFAPRPGGGSIFSLVFRVSDGEVAT